MYKHIYINTESRMLAISSSIDNPPRFLKLSKLW